MRKAREFFWTFFPPEALHNFIVEELSHVSDAGRVLDDGIGDFLEFDMVWVVTNLNSFVDNDEELRPVLVVKFWSNVKSFKNIDIEFPGLINVELQIPLIMCDSVLFYPVLPHPRSEEPHNHSFLVVILVL